jgi:glycosyltransferase involved in cell wall biosynthesis
MTRVSVVLPARDGMPYLREAVGSILGQTFVDFELLVIDDASRDGTVEFLAGIADPRVRTIRAADALGLVAAHAFGVASTSSELVALMGQDDIAEPTRLARQVALLDSEPSVDLVGSWCSMIDLDGRRLGALHYAVTPEEIRARIVRNTQVPVPSMVFRRAAYDAAGGFTADCDYAFDYDLVACLARRSAVANVPEELVRVRYNPAGASAVAARRVQRGALRVRWRTLRAGGYPITEYVWLLKPLAALALPPWLLRRIIVPYMRRAHRGTTGSPERARR